MIIMNQCGFYQRDANDAMFKSQRLKKNVENFFMTIKMNTNVDTLHGQRAISDDNDGNLC